MPNPRSSTNTKFTPIDENEYTWQDKWDDEYYEKIRPEIERQEFLDAQQARQREISGAVQQAGMPMWIGSGIAGGLAGRYGAKYVIDKGARKAGAAAVASAKKYNRKPGIRYSDANKIDLNIAQQKAMNAYINDFRNIENFTGSFGASAGALSGDLYEKSQKKKEAIKAGERATADSLATSKTKAQYISSMPSSLSEDVETLLKGNKNDTAAVYDIIMEKRAAKAKQDSINAYSNSPEGIRAARDAQIKKTLDSLNAAIAKKEADEIAKAKEDSTDKYNKSLNKLTNYNY
jgi:hypothetical protein